MNFIILLLLILNHFNTSYCNDIQSWEKYKEKFNKSYQLSQEQKSRQAYEENLRKIKEHNDGYQKGEYTFRMAPNDLADLNQSLYLKMVVRLTPSDRGQIESERVMSPMVSNPGEIPEEFDWRSEGFITPPCNQKSCGSCYAYSVAHSVSGQIFKRTGRLVMLSEQQIVDCSVALGNHGCAGGSLRNTLRYLESSGGLMRAVDYPYTATVY